MNSKSVLLVEDDPEVLESVSLVLKQEGWTVQTADGLRSAVHAFSISPADIVLTDLMMPGGNGVEVLAALRSIDSRLPVIVATGYGSVENCRHALRAGAFDFVRKPFDFPELFSVLEKALRNRRDDGRPFEGWMRHEAEFVIPARRSIVAPVSRHIAEFVFKGGFGEEEWRLKIVMDEILTNAIVHGANCDPGLSIIVTIIMDSKESEARIMVRDPGAGFDPEKVPEPGHASFGGRGVFLVRNLADGIRWSGRGNQCEIFFRKRPEFGTAAENAA